MREWSVTDGYDCPVVMMSGHGTVETAVEATRLGAFDFVEKPLSLTKLLRTVERALDAGRRKRLSARTHGPALAVPIGKSKVTLALREQVQQAASSSSPVLLLGELGSGREAYARFLHSLSARASKPSSWWSRRAWARIRRRPCSAARRTAASNWAPSTRRRADRCTSTGWKTSTATHSVRWRAPSNRTATPAWAAGSASPLNVRWISSAQDAFELHASPEPFRRDLVAHLNVITLRVPPLRDYAEDVPDLLRYYVDRLVDDQHLPLRRFSVAAQNRLRNYPWPGNIGELKNLVQRVLILGVGEEIRLRKSSASWP